MSIITCPECGTKNRVDESRANQGLAKCGKCGHALSLTSSNPLVITDANFSHEVLQAGATPVLVDCWAAWCAPCRGIAPMIDSLAADAAGRWKVGKLNVDENQRIAAEYRIESIPTLMIFKNGKKVGEMVGAGSRTAIEALLLKWV
jgi:thioredoxin